jgi:hypothetical protein
MPAKLQTKIFRAPAADADDLQAEITNWLLIMTSSNYIIQSMAQSTDVVTTYSANYEDWVDTPYITITFMATYIPTPKP